MYLLTAGGLTPCGSSRAHTYTKTIHRTTQLIWEGAESSVSQFAIQKFKD